MPFLFQHLLEFEGGVVLELLAGFADKEVDGPEFRAVISADTLRLGDDDLSARTASILPNLLTISAAFSGMTPQMAVKSIWISKPSFEGKLIPVSWQPAWAHRSRRRESPPFCAVCLVTLREDSRKPISIDIDVPFPGVHWIQAR